MTYTLLKDYQKSLESYQFAESIALELNDKNRYALCLQNTGKLYSIMNKPNEAIKYYLKAYEIQINISNPDIFITISSLVKEYFKLDDLHNANKWLEKGLNNINSQETIDIIYKYEFEVFDQLINGYNDSFKDLILKKIIPILEG
ncbi:tetratricopeptide repeat protein [Bacillus andreraoultii]|uniref:tetratricopeptide repeat protein n=1 Tax=Bacillus andreraoultii TaxID=1499685 RepID=UPI0009E4933A|nr:tetratricopeptide repeat protein [Bacillus andreraoultii]